MEASFNYLLKHIRSFAALIILFILSYCAYRYYFKNTENFQDMNVVSGGSMVPTKLPKVTCEALTTQIGQYKQLKIDHPDTMIRNLDETIEMLIKAYTDGQCDTYT